MLFQKLRNFANSGSYETSHWKICIQRLISFGWRTMGGLWCWSFLAGFSTDTDRISSHARHDNFSRTCKHVGHSDLNIFSTWSGNNYIVIVSDLYSIAVRDSFRFTVISTTIKSFVIVHEHFLTLSCRSTRLDCLFWQIWGWKFYEEFTSSFYREIISLLWLQPGSVSIPSWENWTTMFSDTRGLNLNWLNWED